MKEDAKLEIRNPKPAQMSKCQSVNSNPTGALLVLENLHFGFVSDFGFRISIFQFQA